MSKYFRPWNIDQTLLLPPNVQDFVPKGHVSRFIVEVVRESLDLTQGILSGVNDWRTRNLTLQLPFPQVSESMGNHDSKIVDAGSVN